MLAAKPVDFRRGIDGLSALCEHVLKQNPRSGTLFVFISRDAKKIKILAYEGNGYWLMTKRLSKGKFNRPKPGEAISPYQAGELRKLLSGQLSDVTTSVSRINVS
ncbi:MAG: IS66 family insertion sequence element accessory protein TnpB [Ferruginibacter sp.]